VLGREVPCGVRGISELPVQICTEVKFVFCSTGRRSCVIDTKVIAWAEENRLSCCST